jgi:hypothetical protein
MFISKVTKSGKPIPSMIISNELTSVNSRSGLCASMETSNLASWFSESSASKSSSNATVQYAPIIDWNEYYNRKQAYCLALIRRKLLTEGKEKILIKG